MPNFDLKKIAQQEKMSSLPEPWGVLYAPPNPDSSKKKCSNCVFWVTNNRCVIHKKDLPITANMVCGFHIYGSPLEEWIGFENISPCDPKLSGLENTKDGTNCETCFAFRDGKCYAVSSKKGTNSPALVEPNGCCARWSKK